MKKFALFILALVAFQFSNAQVEEGDIMISLGVGLSPSFYSGSGYESSLPPLELTGEYRLNENIGVGAFLGYASAEYRQAGFGFDYNYILGGVLGNYHFVNKENLDVYAGAKLGYVSISSEAVGTAGLFTASSEASGLLYGGQVGARYWFSDKFGVNAEVGYGVALVKAGLTLKI